jgi:hypothetical protein
MFGCGSARDSLMRVHDELVDREARADRVASMEEIEQERLNAALEARAVTRRDVLRAGGAVTFGLAATALFAEATHASVTSAAHPVAAAWWQVAAQGREHAIPSIPNETVNIGFFDATLPPITTVESGDVLVYPSTFTHFSGHCSPECRLRRSTSFGEAIGPGGRTRSSGRCTCATRSRATCWSCGSCALTRSISVLPSTTPATSGRERCRPSSLKAR